LAQAVVGILFTMAQFQRNMDMFNKDFPARKPSGPRRNLKTKADPDEVARMKMINSMNIEHGGCGGRDDGHAGDEAIVKATNASEATKALKAVKAVKATKTGEGDEGHEGETAATAVKATKASEGDEGL
jgi:hypothetical protein